MPGAPTNSRVPDKRSAPPFFGHPSHRFPAQITGGAAFVRADFLQRRFSATSEKEKTYAFPRNLEKWLGPDYFGASAGWISSGSAVPNRSRGLWLCAPAHRRHTEVARPGPLECF